MAKPNTKRNMDKIAFNHNPTVKPGSGGALLRTTINNGFLYATNTFNVDSNRFNSIGQTSTSSSSDISGGGGYAANSEFHLKYPNHLYKHDIELVNREKPCGYISTQNQLKTSTSSHLRNSNDRKVKANYRILSNVDVPINNDRNKYLLANKQKCLQKNQNNGNTVM